jgi:hypothetical protein
VDAVAGDDVASHLRDVGATIGLAIELDWLDVVRTSPLCGLVFGFCGPACVVMLVVVLFRLELYTGRMGHPTGHVRSPPLATSCCTGPTAGRLGFGAPLHDTEVRQGLLRATLGAGLEIQKRAWAWSRLNGRP